MHSRLALVPHRYVRLAALCLGLGMLTYVASGALETKSAPPSGYNVIHKLKSGTPLQTFVNPPVLVQTQFGRDLTPAKFLPGGHVDTGNGHGDY